MEKQRAVKRKEQDERLERAAKRAQRQAQEARKEQKARLDRIEQAARREALRAQMPVLKGIPPTTAELRREVQSRVYPYDEQGRLQGEQAANKLTPGTQHLTTKNVDRSTFVLLKKSHFGTHYLLKPEKLPVYPIGFRSRCHENARVFSELNEDFTPVVGYTIVACPCHKHGTLELHSVVKKKATGKLYDITDDMYDEQEKWFVPINPEYAERLPYPLIEFGECTCIPKHTCHLYDTYGFLMGACPHMEDIIL